MTTNICTSIEQSKRLLELGLKPDTADMYWHTFPVGDKEITALTVKEHPFGKGDVPAWSVPALLNMMQNMESKEDELSEITGARIIISPFIGKNMCCYMSDCGTIYIKTEAERSIDAAVKMIEYLIEKGYFKKDYLIQKQ